MKVISASRRTDIPAFYSDWFINRIRAGFCHWRNPFSNQIYRVSLAPEDCYAIVFWTRGPQPLIPKLAELNGRGYRYYFLYTILGYPNSIETHNPPLEKSIETFREISRFVKPDFVVWRYDPIVISNVTPLSFHLERFAHIAKNLAGYTHRCIYSFLDMYGKSKRNLARLSDQHGLVFEPPSQQLRCELLGELARIAKAHSIQMYSCCEDDYLRMPEIRRGSCVDLQLLRQLTSNPRLILHSKPTRDFCGCVESVDIGSYNTCLFGCTYCYATSSRTAALVAHDAYDPHDTILCRPKCLRNVDLDIKLAVAD